MKLLEDKEQSLDELVVRARSDSALKKLLEAGEKTPDPVLAEAGFTLAWQGFFGRYKITDFSWSSDDKYIAAATGKGILCCEVNSSTNGFVKSFENAKELCSNAEVLEFCPFVGFEKNHYLFSSENDKVVMSIYSPDFKLFAQDSIHLEHENMVKAISFSKTGGDVAITTDTGFEVYSIAPSPTNISVNGKTHSMELVSATKTGYINDKFLVAVEERLDPYNYDLESEGKSIWFDSDILDFSVQGVHLAVAMKDKVGLLDFRTDLAHFKQEDVSGIAYSHKGDRLAVSFGANIWVYRVKNDGKYPGLLQALGF
jgi:hypothetical protein